MNSSTLSATLKDDAVVALVLEITDRLVDYFGPHHREGIQSVIADTVSSGGAGGLCYRSTPCRSFRQERRSSRDQQRRFDRNHRNGTRQDDEKQQGSRIDLSRILRDALPLVLLEIARHIARKNNEEHGDVTGDETEQGIQGPFAWQNTLCHVPKPDTHKFSDKDRFNATVLAEQIRLSPFATPYNFVTDEGGVVNNQGILIVRRRSTRLPGGTIVTPQANVLYSDGDWV